MTHYRQSFSGFLAGACALALIAASGDALAGGFDLTGEPVDIIFEEGTYAEGRIGFFSADVEGDVTVPTSATTSIGQSTGQIAEDIIFIAGGVKFDITDSLSAAVILDQPFERSTRYEDSLYTGTSADVSATKLALLGRYKFNDFISVYGGPKVQSASIDLTGRVADLRSPGDPAFLYDIDVKDYDFGYIVGAALEWPEYRARLAVTYNSEVDHDFEAPETFAGTSLTPPFTTPTVLGVGDFETTTPQSVNVDLQAPLSRSTLVRANIRWVNWEGVNFSPTTFVNNLGRPVVEYDHDTIRYRLTVAQRITPQLAGFVTGSYEKAEGESISLFKTTDGVMSLGGGVVVSVNDRVDLTLGGEYLWFDGLSGRQVPTSSVVTDFEDGNGFTLGMKVGIRF